SLLEEAEDIQVVVTASNGVEAITQAHVFCPDVAVIDMSMPLMGGTDVIQNLRRHCPNTRVMILSLYDYPEYVRHALEAGALGYVLKDTVSQDLIAAVRALANGNRYFSEKLAWIAERYFPSADSASQEHPSLPASFSDDSLTSSLSEQ
ncbi:MAG TPA: response regulator transcription factor, partial [Anaerolineales bacterium]|nr:response regulator transcription factor [Anaerolineales bacterium]